MISHNARHLTGPQTSRAHETHCSMLCTQRGASGTALCSVIGRDYICWYSTQVPDWPDYTVWETWLSRVLMIVDHIYELKQAKTEIE